MQSLKLRNLQDDQKRVGISTISFRRYSLREALRSIAEIGAVEVDLGAIPSVVNHVPIPFHGNPADYVEVLEQYGLRSGAVNSDVGDLNDPDLSNDQLTATASPLISLAAATGSSLIVPCGRASWVPFTNEDQDLATICNNLQLLSHLCAQRGVRLQVELLHHLRYVHSVERAQKILDSVDPDVFGLLFDVSHVVASNDDPLKWLKTCADRVERVHLRDAVPGNLNLGIGRGQVDFKSLLAALEEQAFSGSYILELETHDVAETDRRSDARRSYAEILALLHQT